MIKYIFYVNNSLINIFTYYLISHDSETFSDHSELISVSSELFWSSPKLFCSCRNLSETSYLCTQATPIFPKRSPNVVETLSVLHSVREYSGHGRDPHANDRQEALDDYDGPRAF